MAVTTKQMYLSSLPTTSGTLYTVTLGSTAVCTNIVICNSNATAITFYLNFNSQPFAYALSVAANTTITWDVKIALTSAQTITGYASNSAVYAMISGVEIS